MLFDTDILIWVERKNAKAAQLIDQSVERKISIVTSLELMQGARNTKEQLLSRQFLRDFAFTILPLTENIGHRALIYMEQFALSHRMGAMDAIIAATAVENSEILCTSNSKHFRAIKDLRLKEFKP